MMWEYSNDLMWLKPIKSRIYFQFAGNDKNGIVTNKTDCHYFVFFNAKLVPHRGRYRYLKLVHTPGCIQTARETRAAPSSSSSQNQKEPEKLSVVQKLLKKLPTIRVKTTWCQWLNLITNPRFSMNHEDYSKVLLLLIKF